MSKTKLLTLILGASIVGLVLLAFYEEAYAAPLVTTEVSDGSYGGSSAGDLLYAFTNTNAGFGTTGIFSTDGTRYVVDTFITGSANNPPGTQWRVYTAASVVGAIPAGEYTIFFCSGPYGGPNTDCFDPSWTYATAEASADGQATVMFDGTVFTEIGPPTTDFNEVVDYIYDPNLDNTFGTSTVGAIFSIAEPDWVSSIGYDLIDPTGVVVDTDFVNDPVAGTYNIAKEYEFDTTGVYTVRAWFIQETADGYQRIENPVSLSIIINVPTWSFDPVTGDLVPTASTTIATSTLTYFKVECPEDIIIGGLCKMAVGFLIPNVGAIQGVQASFYNLMAKAPFSFFTESKAVLDSFRTTGASTGGSLTLNIFGEEVSVISTTTAATIGLDENELDGLKDIMAILMWMMLAWYLYWRIASIFGV